jgi:hypothetical protein
MGDIKMAAIALLMPSWLLSPLQDCADFYAPGA